jgi:hypothetical protein
MPTRRGIAIALAALLVAVWLPSLAYGSAQPPTRGRIHAAVLRAERSRDLWATVNICNTKHYPNVIGIRGQMPSLGFLAMLDLDVAVDYRPAADKSFRPVPGVKHTVALGRVQTGLRQGGWQFRFKPHAGSLRGSVTFRWRLGGKVLGRVTRTTEQGHHDADFGDPPRYSRAKCVIK